ncbi:MAG: class D sortase [Candidatus Acidiferrales bacterium]
MRCTPNRRISPSARTQTTLRWSRNAFLIVGVLILGYCGFVLLDTRVYQANEIRHFQQQIKDSKPAIPSMGRVQEASFHPSTGKTLGEIELTRIGVTAIILEGTDDRTLRRAVGHIPGTPLPGQPGNVAIAGHRDTFFRALRNVRQDDEITLMTLEGSYRYRVDSISVVGPEDMQVLDNSGGDILTLVTCYPFYFVGPAPRRFIVRAQRISQ